MAGRDSLLYNPEYLGRQLTAHCLRSLFLPPGAAQTRLCEQCMEKRKEIYADTSQRTADPGHVAEASTSRRFISPAGFKKNLGAKIS